MEIQDNNIFLDYEMWSSDCIFEEERNNLKKYIMEGIKAYNNGKV